MKFQELIFLLLIPSVMILSGCNVNTRSPGQMAAVGGAGGAAAGAGIGAIVGAIISNGDIGASTALGAGIGLPVGAVATYTYVKMKNENELMELEDQIEENRQEILTTDTYIDTRKRNAVDESFIIETDDSTQEDLYLGPSLGNPYR